MRFTGATTPRNFSPCGVTLDLNQTVLVQHPERVYTWLVDANVALAECLLVPLYIGGSEPLGTLWIVSEAEDHFDSGHARVMTELATFAGMAVRMVHTEERLKNSLEQQETLTREMSHRVKNMFSIFGGLIRATAKSAATPAEMADVLSGRMQALATAHALVRRNLDDMTAPDAADLGEIVRTILLPHERSEAEPRCVINGPPVKLGDHAINGIALVLHEFATNAAKYGALKYDGGSVAVTWAEADGGLVLHWIERGGPAIELPPDKTGFGTKLSQSTVVGQFNGKLAYDWQPTGLKITMSLPSVKLWR
jgi:two-component sensor histidine kinase